MKKFVLILIILTGAVHLFSQDTLSKKAVKRHVLQLNLLELAIKGISIDYSYFISKKHNVEFMLGYRFNSGNSQTKIGFISFDDPFWLYNQVSTRVGMGYYFSEHFYLTPMLLYNYSFYDRKYFEDYEDHEGDGYDIDYKISRNKNAFGGLVKAGYTYSHNKFRIDFYLGVGYRSIFKNETVYEKINWRKELVPDNYPIRNNSYKSMPTVHLGTLIGLNFK